jgi:hypothetical protein
MDDSKIASSEYGMLPNLGAVTFAARPADVRVGRFGAATRLGSTVSGIPFVWRS